MADFTFNIDVPVRSEWSNVDLMISSVQNCFAAMFQDVDGCHAIAMVTGELLENSIKYGDWSSRRHAFRLNISGEGRRTSVSVDNPVRPQDEGVDRLKRTLAWLAEFPSAEDAYRAKLLEVAAAPKGSGESGLGIIRIAHEAGCKLQAEVHDGVLRVTAHMTFA